MGVGGRFATMFKVYSGRTIRMDITAPSFKKLSKKYFFFYLLKTALGQNYSSQFFSEKRFQEMSMDFFANFEKMWK